MSDATSNPPPTLLVSWAHQPNEGVTEEDWRRQVLHLAFALRHLGVDAEVDLFHLHDRGIEWTRWGPQQVRTREFTLVAVNAAWRQRFEGSNNPTKGAGAAAEANVLLGLFDNDQKAFKERLLIAVLPGATEDDIPLQLRGQQRVCLDGFGQADLEDLLRIIFQQPLFVMPEIGAPPVLPPQQFSDMESFATHERITDEYGDAKKSVVDDVQSTTDVLSIALETVASGSVNAPGWRKSA